jgi:hypothetical protein
MAIQIILDSIIPQTFYDLNPTHDIATFDYQDLLRIEEEIAFDDALAKQKHIILNALKSCQRLLRVYPEDASLVDYAADNFVSVLYHINYHRGVEEDDLIDGFRSAHQIAAISEDNFTRNFPDDQNIIDKSLARQIHRKAVSIKQKVALKQSGLKDTTASKYYSATSFNNVQGDVLEYQRSLPDYENMFGNQEIIAGDESRSALSPAAYFVDLMHLADQYIKQAEAAELTLQFRRPDIWKIPLDADHTYTSVPYLEIVNNVLRNNLNDRLNESEGEKTDSLWAAANEKYPFNLPFHLPLEQIRAYLQHFEIDLATLFQLFETVGTPINREKLEMSIEEYNLLTTAYTSDGNLKTVYGQHINTSLSDLENVTVFLDKTGLQISELEELIFQNFRQKTDIELDKLTVLSLNGTDEYVAIDNFYYGIEDFIDTITIEAWVKAGPADENIILSFDKNEYWRLSIKYDQASEQSHVLWGTTAWIDDAKSRDDLFGKIKITENEWHHIAVSYEANSGKKQIFVNGVLDIEATAHLGKPLGTNVERYGFIGCGSEATTFDGEKNASGFFNGQLTEVRVWSIARKKTDIQEDRNRRLTGKEDHLINYWRLDEGVDEAAFNLITQENDSIKASDAWAVDQGLSLLTNEYQPTLFQQLFINKYREDGKFLSIQKQVDANGLENQKIINLDNTAKDRLNRFIRLAQKMEWSFADLDMVLCSINADDLDETAMEALATIKNFKEASSWSLEVLCSLWADLKTTGLGNAAAAQSSFDLVFNSRSTGYHPNDNSYHPSWDKNPLFQDEVSSWRIDDKEDVNARQLRKWLQASLKLKDRELTAITNYLFPSQEELSLTVENLSLLHRMAQLPKLLGVTVDDFLLISSVLTSDFPAQGMDMVRNVQELIQFTDELKNAGLSIYDWQYLTTGQPSENKQLLYIEAEAAPFLEELNTASVDWLLSNEGAISLDNVDENQAQDIWTRLFDDHYLDADGILLSKYFQYNNSLWRLFQLRHNSFIDASISAEDSQIAFDNLITKQYLDESGNLMPNFNATTNLDFLFTGEEDAGLKQESVRSILLDLQKFYSYFALTDTSFVSDSMTLGESTYIFEQLVANQVLFDNGTLNESFDETTDLSFLITTLKTQKVSISEADVAEIQQLLLQTKASMITLGNGIGELMTQYYAAQESGIVQYLTTFFDTKTDLTESALSYTVATEGILEVPQLLLSLQSNSESQADFIAKLARVLYLADAIKLSAEELDKILLQPAWFGLDSADLSTVFSSDTLAALTTFKQLQKILGDTDNILLQYFENDAGSVEKNEALAKMTGWEQSQIEYLLGSAYFHTPTSADLADDPVNAADTPKFDNSEITADNVSTLYHLNQFFTLAIPIGAEVQFLEQLHQLANLPVATEANWQTALNLSQSLRDTIRTHYGQEEWIKIFSPIQEILQEKERDALAAWLIWILSAKYAQVRTMDDLYDLLLIDVNMSGCMDISYLKEAINCVQLYIHRCQMHLEADVTNKIPKDWWSWMDEYRLWEANRKIFLYPENYLDPALRKSKTSLFKELEDELLQQQVTDDNVSQGLQNYFDKFAELAHLKIADSYFCKVQNPDSGAEEDTLFIFGATRTQPKTYHYRTAVLDPATKEVQTWRPWQKVNVPITADYITPVFAFEKLFLFWVESANKQITVGSDTYNEEGEQTHEKKNANLTKATIKFTFQKKDGSWMVPQNLATDIVTNVSPNLTVDNHNYSTQIRNAISIDLDMESPCWKKVHIHKLPEKEGEPARLMIWLGELVRTFTSYPKVSNYSAGDEPEQNEFNRMLSESALFAIDAQTATWGGQDGYTSLIPAFLIDSGLLIEQKRVFIADNSSGESTIIMRDAGNNRLIELPSKNALADNNTQGVLQQGLIGYWPLNGHANDIAGSNHGNNDGGTWANVDNLPLSGPRAVLEVDKKKVTVPHFNGTASAQFTIEFYVKVNQKHSDTQHLLRFDPMGLGIAMKSDSTNLELTLHTVSQDLPASISTSKWHHLAFTFHVNAASSQVLDFSFYLDGVEKTTTFITNTYYPLYRGMESLSIGGGNFSGQIADVRFWNTIRTEQQINDGITNASLLAQLEDRNSTLLSVKNSPGLFTLESGKETFLITADQQEQSEISTAYAYEFNENGILILTSPATSNTPTQYTFTRLSTNTIAKLSQKLLTGEPDVFYQLTSQYLPELPFDRLVPAAMVTGPVSDLLDLDGANQAYFWEIFFHVPALIANLLNKEQKFAEAKKWYEYIFNPFTEEEPTGLIADWAMNEGDGTTLHDVIDKNNGALYSGEGHADIQEASWSLVNDLPDSDERSVLSFDGSINAFAFVEQFKGFPSKQLTFECWVKTEDTNSQATIFTYTEGDRIGNGEKSSFSIHNPGDLSLSFSHAYSTIQTGVELNDGAWHKLAVSWKEGLGWLTVFVDDDEVFFTEVPDGPLTEEGMIAIGKDGNLTDDSTLLIGQVAEVRVWDACRTPTEIAGLGAYDEPLTEEVLTAYWPLNEGVDKTAYNHVPYYGGTYWETVTDFPDLSTRSVLHFTGVDPIKVNGFPAYPSTEYTIQGWMNMAEQEANVDNFLIDLGTDFKLYIVNKRLAFSIGNTNHGTGIEWTEGQWYHVSLVFTQMNEGQYWNVKTYANGRLIHNADQDPTVILGDEPILANGGLLQFGKDFRGKLADFHFWDVARSAEEILADYNTHHTSDRFWQFLPFRNHDLEKMEGMLTNPREITAYNIDPFDPHAVASMRIGAYEKATAMRYIDNLLDWGDYLFAQDNWESMVKATMLYLVSKNLLGAQPEAMELAQVPTLKTFDNILEDASLNIPDYQLALEVEVDISTDSFNMQNLPYNAFEPYFCIPENGDFIDYWDRVDDRLYKIRNCMNIDGVVRSLALFQPAIDPNQLIGALSSGGSLSSLGSVLSTAIPHYRFSFMIEQAKDLTAQLKGLGAAMLSALEQKDEQQLEQLRASHESAILEMGLMVREKQIKVLEENLIGLEINLEKVEETKQAYIAKQENGPSARDIASKVYHVGALLSKNTVPLLRTPAIAGYLTPTIFGLAAGGLDPGKAVELLAEWANDASEILTMEAELIDSKIEEIKEEKEWAFQELLASYDVDQIKSQIDTINLQIEIAEQELAIQQKSISQAQDMEAFIKDRFTNQELYQWMVGRLSSVYFQTYQLAFDLALAAEKAYQFELNSTASFIGFGTWDSLKKGLLSGEQLMLRLQQLEKAYTDNNKRQLEIEKTVYLSQLDPLALEELKANGTCTFQLTEQLFDLDFPGHYNRKIKTLGLSVQADVGRHQSIQASLIQNDNRIVMQPDTNTVAFLLGEEGATEPDAANLRSNWRTNQQIAISKTSNDNGLFELNFMDDRYLPFEGTGALSSWTLNMPKASNRFNFETLTEVMLHLKYTAEPGGEAFKEEVTSTQALSVESGYRYLSLKEEFPDLWDTFTQAENTQPLTFNLSEGTIAFNLDKLVIGDEEKDIYLFPVPAKYKTLEDLLNDNSFALNGQDWDASTGKVSIDGSQDLPSDWTITTDAGLSEEEITDIVLFIPYQGGLSW